jgi:tetratricopeptide (TPR) repeat protein
LRFAGAAPAPVRQQRGASASSLSRPASLLEADLQIKRALQSAPNNAKWLASKGRSELLEWRYDDAIKSFERALEINPGNPDVLRDLASAHFQKAEAEQRPIDYGTAIEELSEALAQRPNDAVALFNRAIVFEKMFLYQDALRDWEAFLKLEPNGPWSAEARERLNELQAKLSSHGQLQRTPDSDEITAIPVLRGRLDDHNKSSSASDALDEEYLEIATTRWLHDFADDLRSPRYSSESRSNQALQLLSRIFESHHGDHTLHDLLASFRNTDFPKAADLLSESISSDLRGDPVAAYEQAGRASELFEALGNKAGALRAKVEAVYALQRTLKSSQCLDAARFLERDLDVHAYPWMQARTLLEKGSCAAITTGFDDAQRAAIRAGEIATNAGFESLVLRSLSLRSDIAQDKGDSGLCWQVDRQGLDRYWSGSFPILRAYAFYADLGYAAESENRWNLASQVWKEAVPLISETQNRSTEGLARYRLATDEIASGEYREAHDELQRVATIFHTLPQDRANKNYRVASDVSLASVELQLRDYASAQSLLSEVGPQIPEVSQYPTVLQYFETLAEIQVHGGDLHRAEDNFRIAIAIADRGRTSLKDDRDRAGWEQLTDRGYRDLLELCLHDAHRQTEALSVWEYSRSAPSSEDDGNEAGKTPLQIDFQALRAFAAGHIPDTLDRAHS